MIVYAPHNIIKDAPFTKLDLIRKFTPQITNLSLDVGAQLLAKAGRLDGLEATTHHGAQSAALATMQRVSSLAALRLESCDPR